MRLDGVINAGLLYLPAYPQQSFRTPRCECLFPRVERTTASFISGGASVANKGPALSTTYLLDGGGVKLPGSYLGTSQHQAAVDPT